MIRALPVLAIVTIAGCAAGPAKAQPDPVITRLDRLDARADDASEDSALLRRELSDNRFTGVTDAMTAGFQLVADAMEAGFQLVSDKMTEHNDQRKIDNARIELKITALEEAARVPWWIIGSICLGGPVVGVGSYKAGGRKGNGTEDTP